MKRFLIMFMVLGLIAGSVSAVGATKKMPKRVERTVEATYGPSVTLSSSEGGTLRSGSVLSGDGWLFDSSLGGCQMAPDCITWLESGCDSALSGQEPGFMSSIVNVSSLADGATERRFRFGYGAPAGLVWGGAQVQFWDFGCEEIRESRWRSSDCDRDPYCSSTRFRIHPSARWMTVTGYQDNFNLAWTLK